MGQIRVLLLHDLEGPRYSLPNQVFKQDNSAFTGRHRNIAWQVDDFVSQMVAPVGPIESHELQCFVYLLQVEGLPDIDHVDRAIQVVILEFLDRQWEILGSIQRSVIGAQDDQHPVSLFFHTQTLVQADDHRSLRTLIFGDSPVDHVLNQALARFLHFAFIINPVE